MTRPLSRSLERQIVDLCTRPAPYTIEPVPVPAKQAPTTLSELIDATAPPDWRDDKGMLLGQRIPVALEWSTRTIWSSPAVNLLFRAWHDSHHLLLASEFDVEGELRVANYALGLIQGKAERTMLFAELMGQVRYHDAHGTFPENQRAFVRDCIIHGIDATVESGLYHSTEA